MRCTSLPFGQCTTIILISNGEAAYLSFTKLEVYNNIVYFTSIRTFFRYINLKKWHQS